MNDGTFRSIILGKDSLLPFELLLKRIIQVDDETADILKIVCAAGGARSGFNGDSNARLELLAAAGLLAVATLPNTNPELSQRFYRPTKKGVIMVEKLNERDRT